MLADRVRALDAEASVLTMTALDAPLVYEPEPMTDISEAVGVALEAARCWPIGQPDAPGVLLRFNSWERLVKWGDDDQTALVNEYLRGVPWPQRNDDVCTVVSTPVTGFDPFADYDAAGRQREQHEEAVLADLGLSRDDVTRLARDMAQACRKLAAVMDEALPKALIAMGQSKQNAPEVS
jgi:hypothetical protein